jgi:hypothetical protein
MSARIVVPVVAVAIAAALAACTRSVAHGSLNVDAAQAIAAIQLAPLEAGERIYEGRVYSIDTSRTAPLYRYDRRVRAAGADIVTTHLTHDPSGRVVVTQVAEHDAACAIKWANMIQSQSGLAGAVKVVGDELHFALTKNGETSTRIEKAGAPLVAGPTMFGFVVVNWHALLQGKKVPMRFAVLESNRSIGFVLEQVGSANGETTIRMTADSWLLRRLIKPTYFYFDTASGKIAGYDGRVPPLEVVGDQLKTLDARVRYTHFTPQFR